MSPPEQTPIRRFVAPARFRVPAPPPAFVARPELVDRLERTTAPLTVVVGSPGAGKTALVGSWAAPRSSPTVWLSCDPTDVDPVRFWSALAAAVHQVVPSAGRDALLRLDQEGRETPDAVASLASDCGTTPGLAIVIDDFHQAGASPSVVAAFVRSLSPDVRLVLVTRQDPSFPLGRLRAQGRLLEIRDHDLGFSVVEARRLFVRLDIDVSDQVLERLLELTEGWAAGLQLAALSLMRLPDPEGFVKEFANSDRGVADFLVNEVLDLQGPEIAEFLMDTSVLDSYDGALCAAVTGRDDAGEVLRRLHESHLFVIELDRRAGWYRYHHLFGSFLRGRLGARSPDRLRAAHASASRAYALRGDVMSAVDHAMAAADVDGAFQLVRGLAADQLDVESRQAAVDVLRAWLRQHGARHLEIEPRLVLECCLILAAVGASADVDVWLLRVEATGSPALNSEVAAWLAAVWALHRLNRGDPAAALERMDEALRILGPDVGKNFWVSQWPIVASQAHLWLDDAASARSAVAAARVTVPPSTVVDSVRLPGLLAWAAVVEGELIEAEYQARLATEAAESLELAPTNLGWVFPQLSLAAVARDRSDLGEAERLVMLASEGALVAGRPPTTMLCFLEQARLAWAGHRADEAAAMLDRARRIMPAATVAVRDHIDRVEARIAIDMGNPQAAALLRGLRPTAFQALLEARLLLAEDNARAASQILDDAQAGMSTRRLRVEHGLLSARALARDHRARALDRLATTVQLAEPVGLLRPFIDEGPELDALLEALAGPGNLDTFVSQVLDASGRRPATARRTVSRQPVNGLSDREMDVLRYLASRLSYPEIARELYISVNTLKSHVKAVYRKLGASSRAEAVQTARQARLI